METYKIGEPITIKPGDIEPCDSFRLTDELMRRIVEAENVALKNEIEANAVVVNGRKYGMLKNYRGLPPTVFGMRLETKIDMPDDWDFFIQQRPPLVLANGDKIRAMSDEELATFFGTLPCCPPGNADELCFPDNTCGADTKMMIKCWANWLKTPVEEGEG